MSTPENQPTQHSEHWIDTPQGRLFARTWTPAAHRHDTPIVMLHDSLGSVALWRDFPAALSARTGRQVIAYDRLGFGQSDPHPGRLGINFVADEARTGFTTLREQLGIHSFVLFGHSVGGGMAVHCAARHGTDCQALITVSAQAFVEDRTRQGIEEARELFKNPAQISRLEKYHGNKAAWVLDAWISTWLSPAFADWSLAGVLPQVRSPLLAIHGAEDEYGSPRHPQMLTELTGGPAACEIMPQVRHMPHREAETAVLERVHSFLAQHAPES